MRKLRFLFWSRLAGTLALPMMLTPPAQAVLVTATVTITNTPATTNAWTVNGDARYWTNAQTATTILTNSTGIAPSLTNLLSQIDLKPYLNVQHAWLTATQLTLKGSAVAVSFSGGGWATVSYATNQGPIAYALLVPPTNVNASPIGVRTNNANYLADYFNLYGTTALSTNASFGSNYLSRGPQAQVVAGPTVFQTGIGGTNTGLTNGPIVGSGLSNVLYFVGNMTRMSNGYGTNQVFDGPVTTNLVNQGNAISSPGSATGSEQIGTGAKATNTSALAIGKVALAGGIASTSAGNNAKALGDSSVSVGQDSSTSVGASGAVVVGQDSHATTNNTGVFGNASSAGHPGSFVIGVGVSSSTNNEITLGTSAYTVNVPGRVIAASITNLNSTGTNIFGGDASFPQYANSSLANGNNAAILIGTNRYMAVSGPTAAYTLNGFQGGRNGKVFILEKDDSFTMTVANDSGVEPTAAQRIYTGTGGDVTLTNNPGFVEFIYNASRLRWCLKNKSN